MKFARAEVRERLRGASTARRRRSAFIIAAVAYFIVTSLVNEDVYQAAGLDTERAVAAARSNPHRRSMLRNACAGLMEFLGEMGLLTRPAVKLYQRAQMI
jgi:hypothetical protein